MRKRAILVAAAALLLAPAALASWSSSVAVAGMTVSTATLADPTALAAATGACTRLQAGSLTVDLSWTATTSSRATGYVVLRDGVQVGSVAGAASTGWSDTTGQLAFQTGYDYVVEAVVGGWTSPGASVSFTTVGKQCR